ncbi:MAG: hypothetical protein RLZZ447_898, partial [Verrucomicrobiota bacterium]
MLPPGRAWAGIQGLAGIERRHRSRRAPGMDPLSPAFPPGRVFGPGCHYFTFRTRRGRPGLAVPPVCAEFQAALHLLGLEGISRVRTAVVLNAELHVVAVVRERHPADRVGLDLQGKLAPSLARLGLAWAREFSHRLLPAGADGLPTFRYLYRSPYRAGLATEGQAWAGYHCAETDWRWFGPLTVAQGEG